MLSQHQQLLRANIQRRFCFAGLASVEPVGGFTKQQIAAAATTAVPNSNTPVTSLETAVQTVQQNSKTPKPGQYACNSFAIKLSSNPISSLSGLQDAVTSVLDLPVSIPQLAADVAVSCPHGQPLQHVHSYAKPCCMANANQLPLGTQQLAFAWQSMHGFTSGP